MKHLEACVFAQFKVTAHLSIFIWHRLQHFLFGCFPVSRHSVPVSNYDQSRAALVLWLSFHGLDINVSDVNFALDTAIHCATRSNSPLTLQVCIVCNNSTIKMEVLARNMDHLLMLCCPLKDFHLQITQKQN